MPERELIVTTQLEEDIPAEATPEQRRVLFQNVDQLFDHTRKAAALEALLGHTITIRGVSYTLQRLAGEGGFGMIFEATADNQDEPVILKLSHSFDRDQQGQILSADAAAVVTEMATLRELRAVNEDHIFPEYHGGILLPDPDHVKDSPDRRIALTMMEKVEGEKLADKILPDGSLAVDYPEFVLDCARRLVHGIALMHQRGIVHRDLNPHNIMIRDQDYHPTILDYGAAHLRNVKTNWAKSVKETLTTRFVTDAEVASVEPARDVYALGIVLHDLLYGRPNAEQLNNQLVATAHEARQRQRLTDYLNVVAELVERMTDQNPKTRIDLSEVENTLATLPVFEDLELPEEAVMLEEEVA